MFPVHEQEKFPLPSMLETIRPKKPRHPVYFNLENAVVPAVEAIVESLQRRLNEHTDGKPLGAEIHWEVLGLVLHVLVRWVNEELGAEEADNLNEAAQGPRVRAMVIDRFNDRTQLSADSKSEAYGHVMAQSTALSRTVFSARNDYFVCQSVGLDDRLDKSRTVIGGFARECLRHLYQCNNLQLENLAGSRFGEVAPNVRLWMFEDICASAVIQGMVDSGFATSLESHYEVESPTLSIPPKEAHGGITLSEAIDLPVIGVDVKWQQIKGKMLRISEFIREITYSPHDSKRVGGEWVIRGVAVVNMIIGTDQKETRIDRALLPIAHYDDFTFLSDVITDQQYAKEDSEEIIVVYTPTRFFGRGKPKFTVMHFNASDIQNVIQSTSGSQMPKPNWSHPPGIS